MTSGHCLCGNISLTLTAAPTAQLVCHCKNCQRQSGSAFSTLAVVKRQQMQLSGGTVALYEDSDTDSGNMVHRYFCDRCGSPIYSAIPGDDEFVFLKTGILDDTSGFEPECHDWCISKQAWVEIDPDVVQNDKEG